MFQNIGADNDIVLASGKNLSQRDALQISTFQMAIPRRCFGNRRRIAFDAVYRTPQFLRQIAAQHSGTRAQIQHLSARIDLTGKLGERILPIRIQGAAIDMDCKFIGHRFQSRMCCGCPVGSGSVGRTGD